MREKGSTAPLLIGSSKRHLPCPDNAVEAQGVLYSIFFGLRRPLSRVPSTRLWRASGAKPYQLA